MHQTSNATADADSEGAAENEKLEEMDVAVWAVRRLRREKFFSFPTFESFGQPSLSQRPQIDSFPTSANFHTKLMQMNILRLYHEVSVRTETLSGNL